mmetsp:Transcript_24540/g.53504  ORF Transcript_24540/g.53504 Transcript_24540/m.53504 type:complete len:203 (+) Transcript_24540:986-1594(+)
MLMLLTLMTTRTSLLALQTLPTLLLPPKEALPTPPKPSSSHLGRKGRSRIGNLRSQRSFTGTYPTHRTPTLLHGLMTAALSPLWIKRPSAMYSYPKRPALPSLLLFGLCPFGDSSHFCYKAIPCPGIIQCFKSLDQILLRRLRSRRHLPVREQLATAKATDQPAIKRTATDLISRLLFRLLVMLPLRTRISLSSPSSVSLMP